MKTILLILATVILLCGCSSSKIYNHPYTHEIRDSIYYATARTGYYIDPQKVYLDSSKYKLELNAALVIGHMTVLKKSRNKIKVKVYISAVMTRLKDREKVLLDEITKKLESLPN